MNYRSGRIAHPESGIIMRLFVIPGQTTHNDTRKQIDR